MSGEIVEPGYKIWKCVYDSSSGCSKDVKKNNVYCHGGFHKQGICFGAGQSYHVEKWGFTFETDAHESCQGLHPLKDMVYVYVAHEDHKGQPQMTWSGL